MQYGELTNRGKSYHLTGSLNTFHAWLLLYIQFKLSVPFGVHKFNKGQVGFTEEMHCLERPRIPHRYMDFIDILHSY